MNILQSQLPRNNALALLVSFIILFGGSAQFFSPSDIVVRISAIFIIAWLIFTKESVDIPRIFVIFVFLVFMAVVIQLLPLPFDLWRSFPGAEKSVNLLTAANVTSDMRVLSISPTRTLDSLLFMIVPVTGFLLGCNSENAERIDVLNVFIGLALVSSLLGAIQLLAPESFDAYPYQITNEGSAVGIFANRNHQSLFMALAILLIAARISIARGSRRALIFSLCASLGFFVSAVVTQSRAGYGLVILCLLSSYLIVYARILRQTRFEIKRRLKIFLGVSSLFSIIFLTLLASVPVLRRIVGLASEPFNRTEGILISMAAFRDFWLTGSGLGSFAWLAPSYEDPTTIDFAHWNHAHNDWLQLLVELGLLGLGLMLVAISFATSRLNYAAHNIDHGDDAWRFFKLMMACVGVAVLHSLVDYPLRTAAISFIVFWCAGVVDRLARSKGAEHKFSRFRSV